MTEQIDNLVATDPIAKKAAIDPIIKKHNNIYVLRDDLIPGGSKSVIMPLFVTAEADEYVYASTVFGGMQIALAKYCEQIGKKCKIFCAKRKGYAPNTLECISYGACIVEVEMGFLKNVQAKAKKYCEQTGAVEIPFGGHTQEAFGILANRMRKVSEIIGHEPQEIWCVAASGLIVESILLGTTTAKVNGVCVGMDYSKSHERLELYRYPKKFEAESKYPCDFHSMKNYDLKGWEFCNLYHTSNDVLFWNVY